MTYRRYHNREYTLVLDGTVQFEQHLSMTLSCLSDCTRECNTWARHESYDHIFLGLLLWVNKLILIILFSDGSAEKCLNLCVGNFFRAQEAVGEYMEKKLGNKCC